MVYAPKLCPFLTTLTISYFTCSYWVVVFQLPVPLLALSCGRVQQAPDGFSGVTGQINGQPHVLPGGEKQLVKKDCIDGSIGRVSH